MDRNAKGSLECMIVINCGKRKKKEKEKKEKG
jgi:hypothetical protein